MADRAPWGRVYQADLWELWLTAEPAPTTNFIPKNKKKLSGRPRATFFWETLAFGRRFCYYIE
ncbi:MAG: hypothetical protein P5678_26345, partial [Limnospira sp. PMC 1240.20]|uniref:Uncharacterized protein n=2 Tax=Limnospira TaxID=2596745 RepID=A0A9P1KJX0_9CYAN|nr:MULTISPECIES: hypothetical protein [Limnospira]MDT9221970.1 hypothetical protein [Limnospira sp. PMC 1240.20]CDM97773.1 conserved protein of unknown function [Limnospira indica PCC 8005]